MILRPIPLDLDDLSPSGLERAINRALAVSDFGEGHSTNPTASELGERLAAAVDYCELPSGPLQDHHVYMDAPVRGAAEVEARLKKMIHARQNPEVISTALKAASRVGPPLAAPAGMARGKRMERRPLVKDLKLLADKIVQLHRTQPEFADALMAGRFDDALAKARSIEDLTIVCEMAVLWGLHDLQMIAAKLHVSIWAACDGVLAPPWTKPMTIGSFIEPLRDLLHSVKTVHAYVNSSAESMPPSEREIAAAVKIAQKYGVPSLRRLQCQRMGISEAEMRHPDSPRARALIDGFRQAGPLIEHFSHHLALLEAARPTLPSAAARSAVGRKVKGAAPGKLPEKAFWKLPMAMAWYGMGPVEAMAYACICFVKRMETIEMTIARAWTNTREARAFAAPIDRGRLTLNQRATANALIQLYRAAILRDDDHLDYKKPKQNDDGTLDDRPLILEARGTYWKCQFPILPHPPRPLEDNDIKLGRGVALSDKIHGLDVFHKRAARTARVSAEALVRHRRLAIDARFDLSLVSRLTADHR